MGYKPYAKAILWTHNLLDHNNNRIVTAPDQLISRILNFLWKNEKWASARPQHTSHTHTQQQQPDLCACVCLVLCVRLCGVRVLSNLWWLILLLLLS
jgi:hypothetical protein